MMLDAARLAAPRRNPATLAGALVALWLAAGDARTRTHAAGAPAGTATDALQPPTVSLSNMQRRLPAFLAGLWGEARARGISRAVFDRAFADLTLDPEILDRLANQPEHDRSVSDYVAGLASPERIETGRRKLAELGALVSRIEAAYGVDRHVLLAVWGVESSFGSSMGTRPVVRSLATLAIGDLRRPHYWRHELLTVLSILQKGDIAAERVTGSWAGAMGHTQFMPASYAAHAVDFDGDGRRDIWTSVADALASAASFLKAAGWRAAEPWGYEAILPAGFDFAHSAPTAARPIFDWMALGVRPPSGRKFVPTLGAMQLVLPAGADGPAFLVGRNFRAILRYNNSVAYALAVGHLSDRIAGSPALAAAWPATERALDRAERQELQQLLASQGLEPGGVDGMIGGQTKAAIRAFQIRHGLPADGYPDTRLLERLRGGRY
jgi:membrane-bound lytic murein transglycosylase B